MKPLLGKFSLVIRVLSPSASDPSERSAHLAGSYWRRFRLRWRNGVSQVSRRPVLHQNASRHEHYSQLCFAEIMKLSLMIIGIVVAVGLTIFLMWTLRPLTPTGLKNVIRTKSAVYQAIRDSHDRNGVWPKSINDATYADQAKILGRRSTEIPSPSGDLS